MSLILGKKLKLWNHHNVTAFCRKLSGKTAPLCRAYFAFSSTCKRGPHDENDNFRRGYRDAMMGDEWIIDDKSESCWNGVAKAIREKALKDDWNAENLTYL